ncbi:hypothetical protein GKODMF_08120 [Candidatus Electrothrix gigas]
MLGFMETTWNRRKNINTKYQDKDSRQYLREIRDRYDTWKTRNQELVNPAAKKTRMILIPCLQQVELLNSYKDFIDQQHYAEQFYNDRI